MWNRSERTIDVILLLLVLSCGAPAAFVPPAAAQPVGEAPAATALAERIEAAFEVLPTTGGLVLAPREDTRGVRSIELSEDDEIAVNGVPVDLDRLRDRLGAGRAELVAELAELDPDRRRELLGLSEIAADAAGEDVAEPRADAEEETGLGDGDRAEVADGAIEAPAPPAEPRSPRVTYRGGPQTGFGSRVHVERGEVVDDVFLFGGSAEIEGRVDGDVMLLGGDLRVEGEVRRDVTVVGGEIYLGSDSEVGGDVTAVGGEVIRRPGARVGGRIEEIDKGVHGFVPPFWDWSDQWTDRGPRRSVVQWGQLASLGVTLAFLVLLILLSCVVYAIAPRVTEQVGHRAATEPLKAGLVGFLFLLLLLPVLVMLTVLLAITVIGIPIAVVLWLVFVFLGLPALVVMWIVGFAAAALRIGRWIGRRFDRPMASAYTALVVGVLTIAVLGLVGDFLGVFGGFLPFFAVMFGLAGGLVWIASGLVGFGAVVLELAGRWGRRGQPSAYGAPPSTAPVPPAGPHPDPWSPPPAPPAAGATGAEPSTVPPPDLPPEPPHGDR